MEDARTKVPQFDGISTERNPKIVCSIVRKGQCAKPSTSSMQYPVDASKRKFVSTKSSRIGSSAVTIGSS
jgi:hypothetical protein